MRECAVFNAQSIIVVSKFKNFNLAEGAKKRARLAVVNYYLRGHNTHETYINDTILTFILQVKRYKVSS